MPAKISPLQKVDQKYWSGLTKQNNLAYLGYTKGPAQLSTTIDMLYEVNYGDDNIVSVVDKYPTIYVDQENYEWALRGTSERNIPLVKATYTSSETAITSSTTAQVGLNFEPFYLYFSEKWFSGTEVIAGSHPEDYLVQITGDPIRVGDLFRYEVRMYGSSPTLYMPVEELLAGVLYGQLFNPVEREFSKRGSDIHFESFFKLQNTISSIRKSTLVPGSMLKMGDNVPLAYAFRDDNGKTYTRWINYLDFKFYKECRQEKAKLILYGKNTIGVTGESYLMGESGNPIIAGYGLYEQMQGSNIGFYNTFNLDAFASYLTSISYNKLPEDKRKFLVTTGQWGMEQFHKANATRISSAYPWMRSGANYVMGSDGKVSLKEGQITKIQLLNGIEIELMHDPMLDNPVTVGKIPHPNGGFVSSYIYNIWDFGTTNGESNIAKVAIKGDEEYFRYVPGMRDPFSPGGKGSNPDMAAHSIDGYEMHKMMNGSVRIKNPLRTGRYMPNIYKSLEY